MPALRCTGVLRQPSDIIDSNELDKSHLDSVSTLNASKLHSLTGKMERICLLLFEESIRSYSNNNNKRIEMIKVLSILN